MDYRDNFQDMIARYNRELMHAYQKRRREEPLPKSGEALVPEEAAPVAAPAPVAPEEVVPEKTVSEKAVPEEKTEECVPLRDTDTRPRYPLFTDTTLPARFAAADADTAAPVPESHDAAAKSVPAAAPMPAATPEAAPETMSEAAPEVTPEVGYLQIWVTTARDAVPIEGAHVTVSRDENGGQVAYFIGLTDRSGKTSLFPLPAAAAALSQSPGEERPTYTPYNIDVYANGYYRMENLGLPMYGGVKAVLPVQLIPLPENGEASDTLVFPDSGPTALSSEGGRMQ